MRQNIAAAPLPEAEMLKSVSVGGPTDVPSTTASTTASKSDISTKRQQKVVATGINKKSNPLLFLSPQLRKSDAVTKTSVLNRRSAPFLSSLRRRNGRAKKYRQEAVDFRDDDGVENAYFIEVQTLCRSADRATYEVMNSMPKNGNASGQRNDDAAQTTSFASKPSLFSSSLLCFYPSGEDFKSKGGDGSDVDKDEAPDPTVSTSTPIVTADLAPEELGTRPTKEAANDESATLGEPIWACNATSIFCSKNEEEGEDEITEIQWGVKPGKSDIGDERVKETNLVPPDTTPDLTPPELSREETTTRTMKESTANAPASSKEVEQSTFAPISALLLPRLPICNPTTGVISSKEEVEEDDSYEVTRVVEPQENDIDDNHDEAAALSASNRTIVFHKGLPTEGPTTSQPSFYSEPTDILGRNEEHDTISGGKEGTADKDNVSSPNSSPNTILNQRLKNTQSVPDVQLNGSDLSQFGFEAATDSSTEDSPKPCVVVTHPIQTKLPRERIFNPSVPKKENITVATPPSRREELLNRALSDMSSFGFEATKVDKPDVSVLLTHPDYKVKLTQRNGFHGVDVLPDVELIKIPSTCMEGHTCSLETHTDGFDPVQEVHGNASQTTDSSNDQTANQGIGEDRDETEEEDVDDLGPAPEKESSAIQTIDKDHVTNKDKCQPLDPAHELDGNAVQTITDQGISEHRDETEEEDMDDLGPVPEEERKAIKITDKDHVANKGKRQPINETKVEDSGKDVRDRDSEADVLIENTGQYHKRESVEDDYVNAVMWKIDEEYAPAVVRCIMCVLMDEDDLIEMDYLDDGPSFSSETDEWWDDDTITTVYTVRTGQTDNARYA